MCAMMSEPVSNQQDNSSLHNVIRYLGPIQIEHSKWDPFPTQFLFNHQFMDPGTS